MNVLLVAILTGTIQDREEERVTQWIERLGDSDPARRDEASAALVRYGRKGLGRIEEARARVEDPEVKDRLRRIREKIIVSDVPELVARLPYYKERVTSPSAAVRAPIIYALAYDSHGDVPPQRLPVLKILMKTEPDSRLRRIAFRALLDVPEQLKPEDFQGTVEVEGTGEILSLSDEASIGKILKQAEGGSDWAMLVLAVLREKRAVDAIRKAIPRLGLVNGIPAARSLILLGEVDEGVVVLQKMAVSFTHYYWVKAVGALIRAGRKEYVGTLIQFLVNVGGLDITAYPNLEGNINQAMWTLCAATGTYFGSAAEWKAWWEKNRGRYVDPKNGVMPPAPAYVDPSPQPRR